MTVLADVAQLGLDACTLNNALNVAQLVVLAALLKWVRGDARAAQRRRAYGERSDRPR